MRQRAVMLTFDLEEFDMPLEYNYSISFDDQITVSRQGTLALLEILQEYKITATFFCTAIFALENSSLIKDIVSSGHELASHSYFHSKFSPEDILKSKLRLEEISGQTIKGFRMPRMQPVDHNLLDAAGYCYDSSLHPTFIPGRYNNLSKERKIHKIGNHLELPASVTPSFRIPLFWLSFHHFPRSIYLYLLEKTIHEEGYAILYFHPWEFVDLSGKYNLSYLTTKNTGAQMIDQFKNMVNILIKKQYLFKTMQSFIQASGF